MTAAVGGAEQPRAELREFARGGAIGLVGSVVAAGFGFLLTVIVARVLGPAEAGVFFVVVALFTILSEVTELGADTGLVRMGARLRALGRVAELRRVVIAAHVPVLAVSIACAVIVFAAAPWIAATFADAGQRDTAELLVRIAAPALALSALSRVALGGTRGLGSVAAFSLINNVLLPVARPVLIVIAFAAGLGAAGVMLAWAAPVVFALAAALVVLWRLLRETEHDHLVAGDAATTDPAEPSAVREFWVFSGPRGVASAVEMALIWANVPLVGALVSSHDAGIYGTASRFVSTGTLVLATIRLAVAPQIAALLARGEKRRADTLNGVATGWVVASSWPIYLVLACFGPFLLGLFGDDFTGGGTTLAVLAAAMLVVLAAGNVQTVLLMGGKSSWSLANKVIALAVNLALTFALTPHYGIEGAAAAWGIAMLVDTLLATVQVRRLLGLSLGVRQVIVTGGWALVWFGALGLVLRALWGTTAVTFATYLVIACLGYGAVLWRTREGLHVEMLNSALRGRRSGNGERETT